MTLAWAKDAFTGFDFEERAVHTALNELAFRFKKLVRLPFKLNAHVRAGVFIQKNSALLFNRNEKLLLPFIAFTASFGNVIYLAQADGKCGGR